MIKPDLTQAVLMQYETPLPDSFELGAIRERIARVAAPFDNMAGLLFKLYALNDHASGPLNEYSSIYLWQNSAAMRRLLLDELFQNYAETFARPIVRTWFSTNGEGELSSLGTARFALRQTFGIPRQTPVADFLNTWSKRAQQPGALFHVVSFDPGPWELNDLTVWPDDPPTKREGRVYRLAHVSLPGARQSYEC
jgi:Domain of unknown function (DUF4865)